jgi:hypothetical protein
MSALEKCYPLLDKDQPAIPPRSHCQHCDAPVDHRGEYHPTDEAHDAREAVMRLAQLVVDAPRSALIVCLGLLGVRGDAAAQKFAELIGKPVSRQLLYDARVRSTKLLPDLEPLIFDRIGHTTNKRISASPSAMKMCRACGALFRAEKNKLHCQQCRPTCAAKVERQRGVYYPAEG